ncbi:hypothetical protein [Cytobacillus horneckiae]|uniref:DUF4320 domain-containing protein n=1 Tax=Cytobacillus horneckiae TaxID=549687 RepID=A0A2N0Z8D0_9BACI|nr:hypothetical protein [Cytobacillus horneckiae]MEC1158682.1 hypothetical protein [Cytobacillus horneckiae]NRG44032.1 hypothetical protein [Bacillus sp. CRN 9]PKG25763.1 hypothetical protein CWS20_27555 [Cytobacillus horneckiae]
MGEKLGFIKILLIAVVFVIPIFLLVFKTQVDNTKLLNVSVEVQQLVSAEGGLSSKVSKVISEFEKKGLQIELKDAAGNRVNGKVDVGEDVYITYKYKGAVTSNKTTILKRKE